MPDLYLLETRAAKEYACAGCKTLIPTGSSHFRHDPHPKARQFRGEKYSHWCLKCIADANPGPKEFVTRRIRVPVVQVVGKYADFDAPSSLKLLTVSVVGIGAALAQRLMNDPQVMHTLSPSDFEEFICERLTQMGLEAKLVGHTNQKDGGIDIVFWPQDKCAFPFLGAAQVKHHRDPSFQEGPRNVREFAGAIAGKPFAAGILVTNTTFSPDARWFAREYSGLIRLREFDDLRRWLLGRFDDEAEWRELPSTITLCPGVVVKLR